MQTMGAAYQRGDETDYATHMRGRDDTVIQ